MHVNIASVQIPSQAGGSVRREHVAEVDTSLADCWTHDCGGASFLAERQSLTDSTIMTFVSLELNEPCFDLGTETS